jgi:hypothetical protein
MERSHTCHRCGDDPEQTVECRNCEGAGIEPQRPAGKRDTRAPIFDSLHDNVTLRSARERAARASRDGSDPVFAIHCRRFHHEAVRRFIGKAVRP